MDCAQMGPQTQPAEFSGQGVPGWCRCWVCGQRCSVCGQVGPSLWAEVFGVWAGVGSGWTVGVQWLCSDSCTQTGPAT